MRGNRRAAAVAVYVMFFAALALLLALGNWQWRRGADKAAIEAELQRAGDDSITLQRAPPDWNAIAWRRAQLKGAWVAGADFLLANRVHHGRAGFEVFSAFELAGDGSRLLVNRGWVDAATVDSGVGIAATPAGRAALHDAGDAGDAGDVGDAPANAGAAVDAAPAIRGRLYLPQKGFTLGPAHDPAAARPGGLEVFQYFDADAMSAVFGGELQPAVVALDAAHPAAFRRIWRAAATPAARHVGYAVQWWGLAVTLLVFGVVWRRRAVRGRRQ
ncbi:MAG: SURF1 family protein [Gammaproteobacteria bacterium]|nr:SURF1 family protein [Gammaproteobacteria bacterium]